MTSPSTPFAICNRGAVCVAELAALSGAAADTTFSDLHRRSLQAAQARMFAGLPAFDPEKAFTFFLRSLLGARTLGEMLEWSVDWSRTFMAPYFQVEMQRGNGRISLLTRTQGGRPQDVLITEAHAQSLLISAYRWATGLATESVEVSFTDRRAVSDELFRAIFPYHRSTVPGTTRIAVPEAEAARPILRHACDAEDFLGALDRISLMGFDGAASTAGAAANLVERALLSTGRVLTLKRVGDALGFSPAHVRRRLDQEGATFRQIKDETLNKLSRAWLAGSDMTVEQIGEALDFSDANAFRRFFQRVNGVSASAFRNRAAAQTAKGSGSPMLA